MKHPSVRMALTAVILAIAGVSGLPAANGRTPVYEPANIGAPGHYILTRDIGGTISIGADDVILDLDGYKIDATGTGIQIQNGRQRVTVRNGRIAAAFGISAAAGASRTAEIVVEDLAIEASVQAMSLQSIDSISIARCRIRGASVIVNGSGSPMTAQIADNVISDPGSVGLSLAHLSGGSVLRNTVVRPQNSSGIWIGSTPPGGGNQVIDNLVRDLTTTGNTEAGIYVGTPGTTVRGNTVEASEARGIAIESDGNRVSGNHVHGCALEAIYVNGSRNDVFDNTLFGNGTGLNLRPATTDNVYDGNRVCGNAVDVDDDGTGNVAGATNVICVP